MKKQGKKRRINVKLIIETREIILEIAYAVAVYSYAPSISACVLDLDYSLIALILDYLKNYMKNSMIVNYSSFEAYYSMAVPCLMLEFSDHHSYLMVRL